MISQQLFTNYFTGVFGGLYELDVRLDAVFNLSNIKSILEGNDSIDPMEAHLGNTKKYADKLPKLLISLTSTSVGGLPFANETNLMYTKEKIFFRIYTDQDLQILKRNFRLGIRNPELTGRWNMRVDDNSITPAVSLEGLKSLTGYIFYATYEGTAGTIRPIDNVTIK